jgi:hypothetical protein
MIVRPICVAILLLALAGCAAPRGHMPEEAGLPSAAEDAPPPTAMAAGEIDVVALRLALHEAAERGHERLTYDDVWDALGRTDEDPANPGNVILLYTGRSHPKADKDSTAATPGRRRTSRGTASTSGRGATACRTTTTSPTTTCTT